MLKPSRAPHNVAIIYQQFPHYRAPVLSALARTSDAASYVAFSDIKSEAEGLPLIDSEEEWRAIGLPWRRVRNLWFGRFALWQPGVVGTALSSKYRSIIFLGDMRFLSTWIGAVAARMTGKKVLMWGHGFVRSQLSLQERVRGLFYRLAHRHLLYGHRARAIMLSRGFDPDAVYVIYNSLDVERQQALRETHTPDALAAIRARQFAEPGLPLLMTVGRLVERKEISLLLEAAAQMTKAGQRVNVLIIGEGPDRARLEALAASLDLGARVRFAGAIYDEDDVAPLIAAADLCVVPGTLGLTCMHALSYGTPVITHSDLDAQNPEVEAILPGRTGAFFTRGSAESLRQAIADWLAQKKPREQIRQDCMAVIDRFYSPATQARLINLAVAAVPATQIDDASKPIPTRDAA